MMLNSGVNEAVIQFTVDSLWSGNKNPSGAYKNQGAQPMTSGAVASANPESAVDLMLAAMEGYKLRALFEPELCAPSAEQRIGDELLRIVGIRD